ncbi:MAG: hypothetical protein E7231_00280 [Cellulosilyticum sp.]|nr:hypothetical protein [Cellulosilyticum sp.]
MNTYANQRDLEYARSLVKRIGENNAIIILNKTKVNKLIKEIESLEQENKSYAKCIEELRG